MLPGTPVRYEGAGDTGDEDVDACYKNTGSVYKFYKEVFYRNSIDGQGMTLASSTHFANKYDNALWNGQQMVYGDGSDEIIRRHEFTTIDVIAHEMTHGIEQYEVNLPYNHQFGAIKESIADCFAIMCSQVGQ